MHLDMAQALGPALPNLPESLATKANRLAQTADDVLLKVNHDLRPVTTGVPFADGQLSEAELQQLRLLG